ncbi:MAG: TPM domain-containing protein [Chitinophagales bacterium]|nr:TPM domain-containing protein [Chitinophagales bacterium]
MNILKIKCLFVIITFTIQLYAQRNPINTLYEYADVLNISNETAVEAKRNEVAVEKGWEVVIVSHTGALPQINGNMTNWLAEQNNMVVFYLPVNVDEKMPSIEVSDDLIGVLPLSIRQDIAYRIMLPYYLIGNYETALIEGLDALLEDKLILASVTFEKSYVIKGVEAPQWQIGTGENSLENIIVGAVCYKRQDVMSLFPEFAYTGTLNSNNIKIKAVIDEEEYVINGTTSIGNIIHPQGDERIEINTGNVVKYWSEFLIKWYISLDNGVEWKFIGLTDNKVYVIWNEPIYSDHIGMEEELLFYGCNQGNMIEDDQDALINALWQKFENRQLNITDFKPEAEPKLLTYYRNPFPGEHSVGIINSQPSAGNLYLDGECGAFAHLWNYIVNYQGVVSDWKGITIIGK